MDKWTIEWQNDVGPNDGYYSEWWTVSDGKKSFDSRNQDDAIWLCNLLNKATS
jgi:hypothetical protein